MGDQWLRDFEKTKKNALQVAREVQGKDFAERKPDARQAAVLRVSVAQLRQEVSHLEKSLMAISQNTQAHGVTRKELSRRGDLLAGLSDSVESIQEAVRTGMRRRADASGEPPWRDREGRNRDAGNDRLPDGDLATLAEQEVSNQDDTLDFLMGTVHNLKNMGGDISEEIDLHCRLLGEAEEQSESLLGKTKQSQARLNSLREEPVTCYLW
eukprot:CAMPEP_0113819104 /NCGR_PEP_ID=MMETSP0328-20130328/573_1 /TAXON_ID=39455 /ORGANISM="Alexandrium minutum" /LENGTH=210 /DNA_ID=CAMNT_0000787039 /DNA_START=164 /DNA_END=793 /DNA_ORIENTATION=+ /assembly_acc=CAM_ASM_000350